MAFTYAEDLSIDRDYVRFHTGDTDPDGYFLSDAIIISLVEEEGDKQRAVVAALEYIISQLSQPNFEADWLRVDHKAAREGYQQLLATKQEKFGLKRFTGTATHTYRADSQRSEAPTYPETDIRSRPTW